MKAIENTYTTYAAVDGAVFKTEEACQVYENTLPRITRLTCEKPYLAAWLKQNAEGLWHVERVTYTVREVYEAPAFLREGGYRKVSDSHRHSCGFFRGHLADVLAQLVLDDDWWATRAGKEFSFCRVVEVPPAGAAP